MSLNGSSPRPHMYWWEYAVWISTIAVFGTSCACDRTIIHRHSSAALRDFGPPMSASLIGRLGSSAFRLSTNSSVDVAHGLSLLFGLGTKALPSWDSKARWNNLWRDLAVSVTAGSSGHTNSPHPSSREGHHSTVGRSSISSYCV